MEAMNYGQQTIVGATGLELVIALYDGALRSLYRAQQAVSEGDRVGRRAAVKKVSDILLYLQARLRPDGGGGVALALSDFYAAMFALTLEASHLESAEGFAEVIGCVREVREAWAIAARDPEAGRILPRELRTREERFQPSLPVPVPARLTAAQPPLRWSA